MLNKILAAAGSAAVIVALGVAGTAVGTAQASTTRESTPSTTPQSCADNGGYASYLYDVGNGKWAYVTSSSPNLYFGSESQRTYFCDYAYDGSEQFWPFGTGKCLAVNSTTGDVDEDSGTSCNAYGGQGEPWDNWVETYVGLTQGQGTYMLSNEYSGGGGDCMYDDAQEPAIYTGCTSSDHFEWFAELD
jgi:hypothetical protein